MHDVGARRDIQREGKASLANFVSRWAAYFYKKIADRGLVMEIGDVPHGIGHLWSAFPFRKRVQPQSDNRNRYHGWQSVFPRTRCAPPPGTRARPAPSLLRSG